MSAPSLVRPVGEILKLEYGKPLPESERTPHGRFPVYGANGEKARSNRYYVDHASIVIGRKGSAGEINLVAPRFWPLDVTYFVTFDVKRHHLKFLYYVLKNLDLPRFARGVKPGLNRNDVYEQLVYAPSREEQLRIANQLDRAFDAVDIAIRCTEAKLDALSELRGAYLSQALVR